MNKEFAQKIIELQKDFKLGEKSFNEFSNVYYNTIDDYIVAAHRVCLTHSMLFTLDEEFIDNGEVQLIKSTATVTDGENSYSVHAHAACDWQKGKMDRSQMTLSASSFARKQAIIGLFLATEDNTDDVYQEQCQMAFDTIKALGLGYSDADVTSVILKAGPIQAIARAALKAAKENSAQQ